MGVAVYRRRTRRHDQLSRLTMTPSDVLDEIKYVLRHETHPQTRAALIHAEQAISNLIDEKES